MTDILTEQKQHTNRDEPKRENVQEMFDRISPRYDLLNRLLSFRSDVAWRKKVARLLPDKNRVELLDIATGTGDIILTLMAQNTAITYAVGLDMAGEMLTIAKKKFNTDSKYAHIPLIRSDACSLPFDTNSFDATTIAFGIRNVIDVHLALREMYRVIRPGGKSLILEFSLPSNRLIRSAYLFYFRHILPLVGGIISGDSYAYKYLNRTVETFPYGNEFCSLMTDAGFENVKQHRLTFGVASIYEGMKTE